MSKENLFDLLYKIILETSPESILSSDNSRIDPLFYRINLRLNGTDYSATLSRSRPGYPNDDVFRLVVFERPDTAVPETVEFFSGTFQEKLQELYEETNKKYEAWRQSGRERLHLNLLEYFKERH